LLGKFAVFVLALSLFAAPVMACMLPDSSLTDEERDCCQQMAGDCGQMPASHSCCQITVRDSDPYLVNPRPANLQSVLVRRYLPPHNMPYL